MKSSVKYKLSISRFLCALALLLGIGLPLRAQSFGFSEPESFEREGFSVAGESSFLVSGTAKAALNAYFDELDSLDSLKAYNAASLFSGDLSIASLGPKGEVKLSFVFLPDAEKPVSLNEAWVRGYFGSFDITAGLQKLSWGKADTEGPLDVVNPLNTADLRITDQMERKIVQNLVRAGVALGSFTHLEAVFLPYFEANPISLSGPWAPKALKEMPESFTKGAEQAIQATIEGLLQQGLISGAQVTALQTSLANSLKDSLAPYTEVSAFGKFIPTTNTLSYAQAGLRLTTSLGSQDFGFQYFIGNRKTPTVSIDEKNLFVPELNLSIPTISTMRFNPSAISVSYDQYHQLGFDWASVIAGFNMRSELAFNLTKDLKGTDPLVSNPDFAWSLGFDRSLFGGVSLLIQGTGSVILLHDKIGDAPYDAQGAADLSSTRILTRLSKSFLRGNLEFSLTNMWGIEDQDWMLLPEITLTKDVLSLGTKAGFFGGNKAGDFGQYKESGWFNLFMQYKF